MKQQIHVLYIITKLELGGAQKVCLSLVKGLQQSGHHGILISGKEGPLVKDAEQLNHAILIDSFVREISIKNILHELKTFKQLIHEIRLLKKRYPNLIVHTHSTKAGILGRWAAFFAGAKKRVHTIHGYGFNDFQSTIIWALIYTLELCTSFITTHFICVSKKDAQTGVKLFPHFSKKHSIIHAAVEWEIFYQPAKKLASFENRFIPAQKITETPPFTFGTVACFKKQKNLFDLLHAFKMVHTKYSFCSLELIGDGILRSSIETWIQKHNLQSAITLHGWQPSTAPIIKSWNAFVLTSLWEGLPCAVVEARLTHLPIISYKTGGIPEIIKHKKNGLLYEQKDINGIFRGMCLLIEDPFLYKNMCMFNDKLETFKDSSMIHNHVSLYKNL